MMKFQHALLMMAAALFGAAALTVGNTDPVSASTAGESFVTTAKVHYVKHYSIAIWNGYGASKKYAGKKLMDGTSWKVYRRVYSQNQYWYNLGGNQWLAGEYLTVGETLANTSAGTTASSQKHATGRYIGKVSGLGHTTAIVKGSMKNSDAPEQDGVAMTWAGAEDLSNTDGMMTEISGHDRAATFLWVRDLKPGDKVTVTDENGNVKTYTVTKIDNIKDSGYSAITGKYMWHEISNPDQGESIVLQTCLSYSLNRLVWAK